MDLIERIKSGDKKAVSQFYNLYSPRIIKFLNRKLPAEIAAEIQNDVFLDAFDDLFLLRPNSNISAWLYKIASNKAIDYYRKKKIKSVLLSQVPYFQIVSEKINEPEFILEKEKIKSKIETAMRMISVKYAIILRMHYEDGLRVKEIARILKLTDKATESLLFRARYSFIKAYERT